jgi:hypothetical protein
MWIEFGCKLNCYCPQIAQRSKYSPETNRKRRKNIPKGKQNKGGQKSRKENRTKEKQISQNPHEGEINIPKE